MARAILTQQEAAELRRLWLEYSAALDRALPAYGSGRKNLRQRQDNFGGRK